MKGEILFSLFNLTALTTLRVMYYDREEDLIMETEPRRVKALNQGQRERWTPLTKIMHLSYPRLG